MKNVLKAVALLLPFGLAGAAFAQEAQLPMIEDADGSGDWTLAELQTAWPDLSAEAFAAIDADGSGAVTPAELQAAIANGVITIQQ